jgi:peptidoglycan/LPS O-acetylase OafA/YrhL
MPFDINKDVLNLYKTHFAAFPLGVLIALLISDERIAHIKFRIKELFLKGNIMYLLVLVFMIMFGYFSINSGVGESKNIEQTISLITMFSIIFLFVIKNFEIKLFSIFGIYSYEIYLIHWPILSRYDFMYKYLPAWLATFLYLGLFLGISYLLHKLTKLLRA